MASGVNGVLMTSFFEFLVLKHVISEPGWIKPHLLHGGFLSLTLTSDFVYFEVRGFLVYAFGNWSNCKAISSTVLSYLVVMVFLQILVAPSKSSSNAILSSAKTWLVDDCL